MAGIALAGAALGARVVLAWGSSADASYGNSQWHDACLSDGFVSIGSPAHL
jgi:hypothetical protein